MLRAKVRASRRSKSKRPRRANIGRRKLALKRGSKLSGRGLRRRRSKRRGRFQRTRYLKRRRTRNSSPNPIVVTVPKEVANESGYQNSYNDAYQKGFDSGFTQGFEDGHKVGYKERV